MPIEFIHAPDGVFPGDEHAGSRFFFDGDEVRRKLALIEDAGFSAIRIDDHGGLLANLDLAEQAASWSGGLGICVAHWSGVMAPAPAAQHLAAIDLASGGRLSVAVSGGEHERRAAQTQEYLALLKRLWTNDAPLDHEGAFFSVRRGFVERKGPRGAAIPIRMGGRSGLALKIAARHADVFELPAGTPDEAGRTIERFRLIAAGFGRAAGVRLALPVRLEIGGAPARSASSSAVDLAGPPAHVARTLARYAGLGVSQFMIGGLDAAEEIALFARSYGPAIRDAVAALPQAAPHAPQGALAARKTTLGLAQGRMH